MDVDHLAPEPVYRQLARILMTRIDSGQYQPQRPIPSEAALQQEFGVGRDTVRHAVSVLREEGYVWTVPHRGTYVIDPALRRE